MKYLECTYYLWQGKRAMFSSNFFSTCIKKIFFRQIFSTEDKGKRHLRLIPLYFFWKSTSLLKHFELHRRYLKIIVCFPDTSYIKMHVSDLNKCWHFCDNFYKMLCEFFRQYVSKNKKKSAFYKIYYIRVTNSISKKLQIR